ncbi:MAG: hypothetical protein ABEK10_05190, partial [Candidatus Nanosalina sp.]
ERLMEAPEYRSDVSELGTRHEVPAFVEDDAVTKVFPEGVSASTVEENHVILSDAGISFPSGAYWREEVDGEGYDVVQHVKAYGSQDPGFWSDFDGYMDEFLGIGESAAEQGVYLDFKPQNFGVLGDELVYVDTTDGSAVKEGLKESQARSEMAEQILKGIEEAPVSVNEYGLRQVARDLDPDIGSRYSRR